MNDDSIMPWGEHKGKRLGDVPATHFAWLLDQPWIKEYKELNAYIQANKTTIQQQAAEQNALLGSVDDGDVKMETYEDYLKHYRGF